MTNRCRGNAKRSKAALLLPLLLAFAGTDGAGNADHLPYPPTCPVLTSGKHKLCGKTQFAVKQAGSHDLSYKPARKRPAGNRPGLCK